MGVSPSLLSLSLSLVTLVGCGRGEAIDLCGRGDVEDLRTALVGGTLLLRFIDEVGETIATAEVAPTQPEELGFDVPPRAVRLEVEGLDRDGVRVAGGAADIGSDDPCVCVALDSQWAAACGGRACRVVTNECRFYDAVTGEPDGARTLSFGENLTDDVRGVTVDTYLTWSASDPTLAMLNHGKVGRIRSGTDLDGTVHRGLLRFDLAVMPRRAYIEEASLDIEVRGPVPAGELELRRVLEAWQAGTSRSDPGVANWTFRDTTNGPWTIAGCGWDAPGPTSSDPDPFATVTLYEVVDRYTIDVTTMASNWVASPSGNAGLLITSDVHVDIRSADQTDNLRPRLRLRYRLD